ncbi:putative murein peptide carboxypeptidase [compost metagenome]
MAVPVLAPGGNIGIIAPAGPTQLDVDQATRWANSRGYGIHFFPGVFQAEGYLAGSDEVRLADLHGAFADPSIDAIVCLRGGYGSPRLLDQIDFDLLSRHPKPFVGYSDITALLLAMTRHAGFMTFHGGMLASDLLANKQPLTERSLFELLGGRLSEGSLFAHPEEYTLETVVPGAACGRLTGGNLSLIGATLGTPYELETHDSILFIEDVGEPLYRVDRWLTQLRLAGKFSRLRGVLVGDFDTLALATLKPLLLQTFAHLDIPVLAGWRSGHSDPNLALPLGARVSLDASRQELRLLERVVVT